METKMQTELVGVTIALNKAEALEFIRSPRRAQAEVRTFLQNGGALPARAQPRSAPAGTRSYPAGAKAKYTCDVCHKTFTYKGYFDKHRMAGHTK